MKRLPARNNFNIQKAQFNNSTFMFYCSVMCTRVSIPKQNYALTCNFHACCGTFHLHMVSAYTHPCRLYMQVPWNQGRTCTCTNHQPMCIPHHFYTVATRSGPVFRNVFLQKIKIFNFKKSNLFSIRIEQDLWLLAHKKSCSFFNLLSTKNSWERSSNWHLKTIKMKCIFISYSYYL